MNQTGIKSQSLNPRAAGTLAALKVSRRRNALARSNGAFVLAEAMVALLAGILFLLALVVIFVTSTNSFSSMGSYLSMDRTSRNALDQMTRNIRESKQLTSFTSSVMSFMYDSGGLTNLTYRYDPNGDVLTEEWTASGYGVTNTLLTGCTNLAFSLFDRNLAPTTSVTNNTGKVISIAWKCSATNLLQFSSEDMQQAQIVIRCQP